MSDANKRQVRAARAALAAAVDAIEEIGGCIDTSCRESTCWLGRMTGGPRIEAVNAIRFVTEVVADA
jgi:hypothetical protein